jgi:predicted AlkP superfamily pyrophosphatase or phosphodiesterase
MARRLLLVSIDGLAAFYWRDPLARMPTLRVLADRGVIAQGMETVFPSTTWPTHASLVTGVSPARHGVAANHVLNRATGQPEDLTGDPVYDAAKLLREPTLYDRAHARGLRTAAVDWPCTRRAPGLDWNLPFFKDQGVFESHTAPAVWRELGEAGFPLERQGEWAQLPKRFLKDAMVADAAVHVLGRHAPDVLLVHFLSTDSFQHLYGPRSPEAYWAIGYVDACLGRVVDALGAGALDRDTVVCVVSDHGFLPVRHEVRVNVRLRQLGLLTVDAEGRIDPRRARLVMNHGAAYLYVLGGDREATARDLRRELVGLPGVAGVWEPVDYPALGLPSPDDNPLAGDLVLEAVPGYSFGDEARGDDVLGPPKYRGTHGHRPAHPDNAAFFLAAGAGFQRGVEIPAITSRDVAPTLGRLLGLHPGDPDGRVLTEALD